MSWSNRRNKIHCLVETVATLWVLEVSNLTYGDDEVDGMFWMFNIFVRRQGLNYDTHFETLELKVWALNIIQASFISFQTHKIYQMFVMNNEYAQHGKVFNDIQV